MDNTNLLCVAIMVKNEAERICKTLSTIIKHVQYVVILDTGSTDDTINVITKFCRKNGKKTQLKVDTLPFVDFSHNRNYLLKMCRGLSEFILLLDANDEVINPSSMVKFLKQIIHQKDECIFECMFKWDNDLKYGSSITYYKISIIRNNIDNIYYELPVHEFITCNQNGKYINNRNLTKTNFYIYQDRSKDKSSIPRIKNDVLILKNYIDTLDPSDKRIIRAYRYLCQSYRVLKNHQQLYEASKILIEYIEKLCSYQQSYNDDYYFSLMYNGIALAEINQHDFNIPILKAYKYKKSLYYDDAEPLLELASLYAIKNQFDEASLYIKKCCQIDKPNNIKSGIFKPIIYDTDRWLTMYKIGISTKNIGLINEAIQMYKGSEKLSNPYQNDSTALDEFKIHNLPEDVPPELLNKINLNNNNKCDLSNLTDKQREEISKYLSVSTQKSPPELKAQSIGYKCYILVAYHNQVEHLQYFITTIKSLMTFLQIEYEIVVIEHDDHNLFNKGMLYNIGYKKVIENNNNIDKTYICFHDIDVVPIKATNYYKPDDHTITHLYGYDGVLAGVFLINSCDYRKMNGFSNLYKGTTYENNDLGRRSDWFKIKRNMNYFYQKYNTECFKELDPDSNSHIPNLVSPLHHSETSNFELDGLLSLIDIDQYISSNYTSEYTHLKVKECKIYDL